MNDRTCKEGAATDAAVRNVTSRPVSPSPCQPPETVPQSTWLAHARNADQADAGQAAGGLPIQPQRLPSDTSSGLKHVWEAVERQLMRFGSRHMSSCVMRCHAGADSTVAASLCVPCQGAHMDIPLVDRQADCTCSEGAAQPTVVRNAASKPSPGGTCSQRGVACALCESTHMQPTLLS